MIPDFVPFKRVGDFQLQARIENYTDKFDLEFIEKDGKGDSDKYMLGDITLFTEEGVIESICCDEECFFKGRNIIGITIEEFMNHTEEKYYGEVDELEFEEDNIPQYVYEFEDIGLQVWVKNKKIVTVIASMPYPDENEK